MGFPGPFFGPRYRGLSRAVEGLELTTLEGSRRASRQWPVMHPSRATGDLATFGVRLRGPPDPLTLPLPDGLGEGRTGVCLHRGGGFAMNDQAKTRQAVSAAVVGNVLEWYDFSVYAFVAVILSRKFFPPGPGGTAPPSPFLPSFL